MRAIGLRGMGDGSVVDWDEDGSNVRPGPEASHYEAARKECGAQLLFNAFGKVTYFCVHQMLMRDHMHQIDLGIIIRLISAILKKYWEDVLIFLKEGLEGLAAKRLEERLRRALARRTGRNGQRYVVYIVNNIYATYIAYVTYALYATVIAECMTVLCLLLCGLPIFLKASERLAKSLAKFARWICAISCSCSHFCCPTCCKRKLRNTIATIHSIPYLTPQINALELYYCFCRGTIYIVADFLQRTSWTSSNSRPLA